MIQHIRENIDKDLQNVKKILRGKYLGHLRRKDLDEYIEV